jgi:oxygen-independent coproporphyrinogen-3 oxidase
MPASPRPLAIYVHIPFCARHCAYCDFNVTVEREQSPLVLETVDAICRDIERAALEDDSGEPLHSRPVTTVFFGGGTPTFLTGAQLTRILATIRERFALDPDAEISSEANPGSSDAEKFAQMRAAGFNRLSVGVQAFDDRLLAALDRTHTAGEAERALRAAREAGFDNLNLDLMFALPQQTTTLWEQTLGRALALGTEHLSLYALTLEPGTRFERLHAGGKLDLPGEDAELEMYERSIEILTGAGYEHYEVSNFARPGFRSRHNHVYWRNEEYLGMGPGAVSYLNGRRWKRERLPARYNRKVAEGADLAVESECLDADGTLGETMMLGLRLRDGLPLQRLRDRFGVDPLVRYAAEIDRLAARGLLTREGDALRLTHRGLLLANDALSEFLP